MAQRMTIQEKIDAEKNILSYCEKSLTRQITNPSKWVNAASLRQEIESIKENIKMLEATK